MERFGDEAYFAASVRPQRPRRAGAPASGRATAAGLRAVRHARRRGGRRRDPARRPRGDDRRTRRGLLSRARPPLQRACQRLARTRPRARGGRGDSGAQPPRAFSTPCSRPRNAARGLCCSTPPSPAPRSTRSPTAREQTCWSTTTSTREMLEGVDPPRGRYRAWTDDEDDGEDTLEGLITAASDSAPPKAGVTPRITILTSGTTGTPKGAPRPEPRSLALIGGLLSKVPVPRARDDRAVRADVPRTRLHAGDRRYRARVDAGCPAALRSRGDTGQPARNITPPRWL